MSAYSVYLVDDERMIREGIGTLIPWEQLGLRFIGAAPNGMIAYQHILDERPDIVITDIMMPEMNGLELIKQILEHYSDMQFIILSGYSEFEFAARAMQYGVKHYLLKPCNEAEITEVLLKVVGEVEQTRSQVSYMKEIEGQLVEAQLEKLKYHDSYGQKGVTMSEVDVILQTAEDEQFNLDKNRLTVHRMVKLIHDNLSNKELSLQWMAKEYFYMNVDYLGKLFRREMKERFSQYVTRIRIEYAMDMIRSDAECKFYEIAEKSGFGDDAQYFSNVFKRYTGRSPSEYKRKWMYE